MNIEQLIGKTIYVRQKQGRYSFSIFGVLCHDREGFYIIYTQGDWQTYLAFQKEDISEIASYPPVSFVYLK